MLRQNVETAAGTSDKADKTALDAKADKTELDEKADKSALKNVEQQLVDKADKTALDAKADKTGARGRRAAIGGQSRQS